jgi:hypothetical protein
VDRGPRPDLGHAPALSSGLETRLDAAQLAADVPPIPPAKKHPMTPPDDDAQLDQVKAVLRRLQRISADTPRPDRRVAQTPLRPGPGAPRSDDPITGRPDPVTGRPAGASPLRSASGAITAGSMPVPVSVPGEPAPTGSRVTMVAGAFLAGIGIVATIAYIGAAVIPPAPQRQQSPTVVKRSPPTVVAPEVTDATAGRPPEVAVAAVAAPPRYLSDPALRDAIRADVGEANRLLGMGRVTAARNLLQTRAEERSPDVAWGIARTYDPSSLKVLPGADATADISKAEQWYRTWHELSVQQGLVTDGAQLERLLGSLRSAPRPAN